MSYPPKFLRNDITLLNHRITKN